MTRTFTPTEESRHVCGTHIVCDTSGRELEITPTEDIYRHIDDLYDSSKSPRQYLFSRKCKSKERRYRCVGGQHDGESLGKTRALNAGYLAFNAGDRRSKELHSLIYVHRSLL